LAIDAASVTREHQSGNLEPKPTLWNRADFSVAEVFYLLVCGVLPSCL
jgi:hypothetical protein